MGNARTYTVANLITEVQFDLRDKLTASRYETNELLAYFNRCYEMIYMILVGFGSDLVYTGSGTITTVAGTETYALASNTMGDFWLPYKLNKQDSQGEDLYAVYLTDSSSSIYPPLPMVTYDERFDYLQGGTSSRAQPQGFYLSADNFGLLPVPDAVYTVTIAKYCPNFVVLATSDGCPFRHTFNQDILHGMSLFANNRNDKASLAVETQLMDFFRERAMKIIGMRTADKSSFSPRWRR
jgi:hypothetical protein